MTRRIWRSPGDGNDVGTARASEPLHGIRRHYRAVLGVGLVVSLDALEIVEVVHHQAVRLAERLAGGVGEPVDLLEAGAVAEVEACHRVARRSVLGAGVEKIPGGGTLQGLAHRVA